ncbi:MAG: hypothetical protein WAM79_07855 [Candidatus Sulfotelmatobacter sp.]
MNCKKLLVYLQENPGAHTSSGFEDAEISSHLAVCVDCARLCQEQRELGENIGLARVPACKPSPALDTAVLANYRRQASENKKAAPAASAHRFRPLAILAWSAVAAALVVAAVLFFPPRRGITRITAPTGLPSQSPPGQIPEKHAVTTEKSTTAQSGSVAVRNKRSGRSGHISVRPQKSSEFPQEAFRSLMYCDELSCSDAMEMIRVELPASFVTRPVSGSAPANGVVTADVLVGADGIARGIRIEE